MPNIYSQLKPLSCNLDNAMLDKYEIYGRESLGIRIHINSDNDQNNSRFIPIYLETTRM